MTQLGLIFAIDIAGLVFALLLARALGLRDAGTPDVRRLAAALERAARSFLWREYRLVAIATLALVGVSAGLRAGWPVQSPFTRLEGVFWTCLSLMSGAALAAITVHASVASTVRASHRAAVAAGVGLDRGLTAALRACGSSSLFGETLSALGVCSLFGVIHAVKGGFAAPPEQAVALAAQVVWLLPAFVVGAAAAALIVQRGGGTYHAACGVGADHAGQRDAGLEHDDPKNPAVLSELVGDHVGAVASRAVDAFLSASASYVAALIVGASLTERAGMTSLAWITLPIVVRAFGVIAAGFGVMLVRAEEGGSVGAALLRGHLSTLLINLVGIFGACFWLVGERWWWIALAGSSGVIAVFAAAHSLRFRVMRGAPMLTEASECLRVDGGTVAAASLGIGLQTIAVPIVLVAISAIVALRLGSASPSNGTPALAVLVWASSVLACSPYVLAVGALGPTVDAARGIAAIANGAADARRRLARLDDTSFVAAAVARQYLTLAAAVSAVLALLALESHQGQGVAQPGSGAALLWCAALGACWVLSYAGSVARAAARAARGVAAEVERQLRGYPREHGLLRLPPDYTPSYRGCLDLASSAALRKLVLPSLLTALAPFALGFTLRLLYRSSQPGLALSGLMWFVAVAAITALGATLSMDAARAALGMLRRANRSRDAAGGFGAAITANALADVFGNSAGPAAQLLVQAAAGAALLIAPFLS